MEILVVDDEKIILDALTQTIKEVVPQANVHPFNRVNEALNFAKNTVCDIAFLDIEMTMINGISFAKQLKELYPDINIIFVTGYSDYALQAFELKASGYVLKPFTKEDIQREINDLRNNKIMTYTGLLTAQCFGQFNVYYNRKLIKFKRNKSKELLAYLIYKKGEIVHTKELKEILFDSNIEERNKGDYLQKIKKDIKVTLSSLGLQDVVYFEWNKYAVDPKKITCDYYDYLENKPNGIRAYNGKFMQGYSWAKIENNKD